MAGVRVTVKKCDEPEEEEERSLEEMGYFMEDIPPVTYIQKTSLEDRIRWLYENHFCTDLEVCIGDVTFNCHLLVLKFASSWFRKISDFIPTIYIFPENVTPKAFAQIYDWILKPEMKLQREGIVEVMQAAKYFDMDSVEESCWRFLAFNVEAWEDRALEIFMEAKQLQCNEVVQHMMCRISKSFLMMVSTDFFLSLTFDEVWRLLRCNSICVNGEIEVLLSGILWLDHDWLNRKQHMLDIIKCTRFIFITPKNLSDMVDASRYDDFDSFILRRALETPEISTTVQNAFVYSSAVLGLDEDDHDGKQEILNQLGEDFPESRQWIIDPLKKLFVSRELSASYQLFKQYLEMLRMMNKDYYEEFMLVNRPLNLELFDTSHTDTSIRAPSDEIQWN